MLTMDEAKNAIASLAKLIEWQGGENERLRRFLGIALDAYEDLVDAGAKDPNIGKPGHFTTQARKLLAHEQSQNKLEGP